VRSLKRLGALKKLAFTENGFDGYLICNNSNLFYFLGFSGASALLVPENGESTIYVYGVNYEQARAASKGFAVELVKRGEDLMSKIVQRANERGVKKLAFDTLGIESWHNLTKLTKGKITVKIKPDLVFKLRAVKDETEIELIRKACELTSEGMKTAYEVLSLGMRECEVAAEIEYAMRKRGSYGTSFDTAVSSGASSAFPHGGCSDRKICTGDLVVIDFGAIYKSYCSDMTRTLVAGKPSEKQLKLHEIVRKAQEMACAAIKPNAKTSDVDAVARRVIEQEGYGAYFVHGLGHGVGLDIHEPPILNPASNERLQAGNVITNEPGIYIPSYGGVRIEDTILVTKKGAEKLTKGFYRLGLN
jgi:Xaa-Pro aminopeptidase